MLEGESVGIKRISGGCASCAVGAGPRFVDGAALGER